MPLTWLTNDPEAAKALRNAERAFNKAKSAASNLSLADKVFALKTAQNIRQAAYDAVQVA